MHSFIVCEAEPPGKPLLRPFWRKVPLEWFPNKGIEFIEAKTRPFQVFKLHAIPWLTRCSHQGEFLSQRQS
jgi:hypothetical protein